MAIFSTIVTALLLVVGTHAHFLLNHPQSIGFSDDEQRNGPCGGFTPDFAKNTFTDFHVGGENIATRTTHNQGNWLYRITLDPSISSSWTQIFPIVQQNGLGSFCQPLVPVPVGFVGQKGILSVVSNTGDGLLFQCAAVNFVNGVGTTQSSCSNATSVTAQFTTDTTLATFVGQAPDATTPTPSTSASHSHTEGTAAATSRSSASTAFRGPSSPALLLGVFLAVGWHAAFPG